MYLAGLPQTRYMAEQDLADFPMHIRQSPY